MILSSSADLFSVQADPLEADSVHAGQAGECVCRRLHQWSRRPAKEPRLETPHDRDLAVEH